MIRDGALTLPAMESPLSTLQFVSRGGHAILVAVLTTVLSYQASAVFFDLFFGIKQSGVTKVTDLFVLHFSRHASFLAILSELTGKHRSRHTSFSRLVALKLLLLLLGVFVINLFSMLLSLESDRLVTFGDAGFGGVAVGIPQPERKAEFFNRNGFCNQYVTNFGHGVTSTPDFLLCIDYDMGANILSNTTITYILKQAPSYLSIEVKSSSLNNSFEVKVTGTVRIGADVFRIRQNVAAEELQMVWTGSSQSLRNICEANIPEAQVVQETNAGVTLLSLEFPCKFISFPQLLQFLGSFLQIFSLVEADTFDVQREGDQFFKGDDLLLFKRRRPYVDLVGLLAATAGVVLLRIVVKLVTTNDVALGIELVLKKSLNMGPLDSMLHSRTVVSYGNDDDQE